jgi:hypothetical protein
MLSLEGRIALTSFAQSAKCEHANVARKKNYTMVRKDLERADIPYEAHEELAMAAR